jgi:2-hydroxy-3-oxopropionate reductase
VRRVAFIGLGTMGLPMARHLVAAGHEVVGCDLDPERVRALRAGAVRTVREAAAGAEAAILSLPGPEAVERVAEELPRDVLLVDMSTGPPSLARRLAQRRSKRRSTRRSAAARAARRARR